MKKIFLLAFVLWLLSTAVAMTFVSQVVAEGTIYIRSDGSVDPSTAPIQRDGNVYTLTDNIYDSIVVERNNIVIDGASHILQGTGDGTGIYLSGRSNVAIQNMQIRYFDYGIYLRSSSGNNIYGNTITNNEWGIYLRESSDNNILYGNTITNNEWGIQFYRRSSKNIFYHNSFIDNTGQVYVPYTRENIWDDGYPSGGNYWSDYRNRYPNATELDDSGLWDTPYVIDENNQDNYPLMSDLVPPIISMISPENKTYGVADVPLSFIVSEAPSWRGYSLDGQTNETVKGDKLVGLSDGIHTIIVYANDTAGNMGHSDTIYFTVDTVTPNIEITSPENKTYAAADVPLSFTVSETTTWEGYSLDGQANKPIPVDRTLRELSDGMHSLVVYATDVAGNTGHSDTIYFTVDTTLPSITILSPENKTYAEDSVPLSFTVDKAVSWMSYSLDGQAHVTITGNTTLSSLVDGTHYIVVYANNIAGKMGASNTVYFTVDTKAPIIILLSPKNETYASTSLSLNFTRSEPTFWMGYSLDGQMNVTVGGNTTLVGLSEGIHSITVYATDIAGNMGSSDIVYFTVDTVSVSIDLLSPQNKTYAADSISLIFEADEETSWMGYSLDGQANNTITGDTTLIGLSDGMHSLVVYASDMFGNTGSSDTVYFTVDTVLPNVEVLSPENKTYAVTDVPLVFTLSEETSWMGYSLDDQMNLTVSGNITLVGLSDGVHTITVYANDTAGNVGRSVSVYFTTNALPPNIELFSPENKTYTTNSVSLNFSVNEPTLWKGYSLDGQANVTIFGDITLAGLSEGSHSLVVYAKDMTGNTGTSGIVYFAVETRQTEPSQLWVVAVIAIVAGVGFALSGYMAYDLFKRAQK
jgi:parallel beta-helix repeat protein